MSKITDMITAIRYYFSVEGQWCIEVQQHVTDAGVVQYCLAGAASAYAQGNLGEASGFLYLLDTKTSAYYDLAKAMSFASASRMTVWNNEATREEVVARLDEALAEAA